MASIIYIGNSSAESTSRHRADALQRLGHRVVLADPYLAGGLHLRNAIFGAAHFRTGYRLLQFKMRNWVAQQLERAGHVDIAWIDSGELLGADCLRLLRTAGLVTVLYNHDDPTGNRDGRRFDGLLPALPFYDLCAVPRQCNIMEYERLGAKSVVRIWMGYDEIMHAPYQNPTEISDDLRSEVAFIGTWMRGEKRDEFLLALIERGIPVSVWGARWDKSPVWRQLRNYYRGNNLAGRAYVGAIQGSKVCLGMLSSGNRDLHTTRSMEIPYAGGVLCAQRTTEHLELYKDDSEAVFWSDVDECAQQCRKLLDDEGLRESVRVAGMARVRALCVGHEDMGRSIIETVLGTRAVSRRSPQESVHLSADACAGS